MYMKKILFFVCTMLTWLSTDATAKTLVVYYSYTGNSREIVNTLTSQMEADVLEIQPAEKGLKYEANNYALGTQLLNAIKANPNDANSYPAIDPVTTSPTDYQNIIIVTPLWWSQMAAITQAQKDSWFQHLTYHKDVQEGASNEWCEPVTDEVYDTLK